MLLLLWPLQESDYAATVHSAQSTARPMGYAALQCLRIKLNAEIHCAVLQFTENCTAALKAPRAVGAGARWDDSFHFNLALPWPANPLSSSWMQQTFNFSKRQTGFLNRVQSHYIFQGTDPSDITFFLMSSLPCLPFSLGLVSFTG